MTTPSQTHSSPPSEKRTPEQEAKKVFDSMGAMHASIQRMNQEKEKNKMPSKASLQVPHG